MCEKEEIFEKKKRKQQLMDEHLAILLDEKRYNCFHDDAFWIIVDICADFFRMDLCSMNSLFHHQFYFSLT